MVLVITGLNIISYFLPSYDTSMDILPGYECAAIVVMEIHEIFTNPAVWDATPSEYVGRITMSIFINIANPIFWIIVIWNLRNKPLGRWAFILSVLSTISAFYWVAEVGVGEIDTLKIGYWLWSFSILGISIITVITHLTGNRSNTDTSLN